MKRMNILLVVLSMTLLTGCDFFRSLAGRPTSDDIEKMKGEIETQKTVIDENVPELKVEQENEDSLLREAQVRDSIAVMDSLDKLNRTVTLLSTIKAKPIEVLDSRYYIMVGSFRKEANVTTHAAKMRRNGYEPYLITYDTGLISVSLCPSNSVAELERSLEELKKKRFFPKDAWVLYNR